MVRYHIWDPIRCVWRVVYTTWAKWAATPKAVITAGCIGAIGVGSGLVPLPNLPKSPAPIQVQQIQPVKPPPPSKRLIEIPPEVYLQFPPINELPPIKEVMELPPDQSHDVPTPGSLVLLMTALGFLMANRVRRSWLA